MILVLYSNQHKSPKWWWRPALGAGFCGGFTTYSAFSLKIEQYFTDGKISTAVIYALVSLVGTYILVFATKEFFKTKWAK
jgi:fluoride ion exporter CrcB/FEX